MDHAYHDLSTLDPQVLKQLAEAYGLSQEEAAAMMRQRRGEALAGQQPAGEGRYVRDRIYVAGNPGAKMLGALGRGLGFSQQAGAERSMLDIGRRRVAAGREGYGLFDTPLTDANATRRARVLWDETPEYGGEGPY